MSQSPAPNRVLVHVWLPEGGNVGHASLTIGGDYVSFWPETAAGKSDLKIKRSQPGMFVPSLHEDILNEGHRQPQTILLEGLDAEAMLDFIAQLQANSPRYQLARHNCSHVVARALMAGAGRGPTFTPHAGLYHKLGEVLGRGIWTPDQVLKFARELESA